MANSCIIRRNNRGRVESVRTQNGNRSSLFDKIAGIPLIENMEKALDLFKLVYTDRFKKRFGDWQRFTPKNKQAYDKVKNLTKDLPKGERIAVLEKAASMVHPVFVSRANKSNGSSIFYKEGGSGAVLIDAATFPELVSDNKSDVVSPEEYESALLENNAYPVVSFTDSKGNKYIVAKSGVDTFTPSYLAENYKPTETGSTGIDGEPRLFFITEEGELYENYGDALKNTHGAKIEAGFVAVPIHNGSNSQGFAVVHNNGKYIINDTNAFIPIVSLSTSTNVASKAGLVNLLIKKGYLSGEKEWDAESKRYKFIGDGYTSPIQMTNSIMTYHKLIQLVGSSRVSMNSRGQIEFTMPDRNKVTVMDVSGNTSTASMEDIKRRLERGEYGPLSRRYPFFNHLVLSIIAEQAGDTRENIDALLKGARESDRRQRLTILNILKSLGVRVIGMSEYLERYQTKYGAEPSARALADMANNVIAVAEDATIDDLMEEAAHFLVEAYQNQSSIEEILEEVEFTEEWAQYASTYFGIYGKTLKGEELTNAVRREILGKILSSRFRETINSTEDSFLGRVGNLLRSMVNSIRSVLTTQRDDLNSVLKEIEKSALADDFSAFDTERLKDNSYTMYSVGESKSVSFLRARMEDLKRQMKSLRRLGDERSALVSVADDTLQRINERIDEVEKELEGADRMLTMRSMISTAEAQIAYIERVTRLANSSNNTNGMRVSNADRIASDIVQKQVLPFLQELRKHINYHMQFRNSTEKADFLNRIDVASAKINAITAEIDAITEADSDSFIETVCKKIGVSIDRDVNGNPTGNFGTILNMFKRLQSDTNFFARWFGILEHSSNIANGMLGALIARNNYEGLVRTQESINEFLRDVQRDGWTKERFERLLQKVDGGTSNYLRSRINYAKFEKDMKMQQLSVVNEILNLGLDANAISDIADSGESYRFDMDVDGKKKVVSFLPTTNGRPNLHFLSASEQSTYDRKMAEWIEENTEGFMSKDYRIDQESVFEDAFERVKKSEAYWEMTEDEMRNYTGISESTRRFLKNIDRQKWALRHKYADPVTGEIDVAAWLASAEYQDSLRLDREKREAALDYMYIGTEIPMQEKSHKERLMAAEIRAINEVRGERFDKIRENPASGAISSKFMSAIRELEESSDPNKRLSSEEVFKILCEGGHFGFSESFWKRVYGDRRGDIDGLPAYLNDLLVDLDSIDGANHSANLKLVTDIAESRAAIREIMSMYRSSVYPGETDVDGMSKNDMESILSYQLTIDNAFKKIYEVLKDPNANIDMHMGEDLDSTGNDSYHATRMDAAMESYRFAKRHTTEAKAEQIDQFSKKIMKTDNNGHLMLNTSNRMTFGISEVRFILKYFKDNKIRLVFKGSPYSYNKERKVDFRKAVYESLMAHRNEAGVSDANALALDMANKYAETKLLPYYRRSTPAGFLSLREAIRNGDIKVSELLEDMANSRSRVVADKYKNRFGFDITDIHYDPYLRNSENDTFFQEFRNPNYEVGHGYGRYLPNVERYEDKEFIREFGLVRNSEGEWVATRNADEYNMIERLKGISENALKNYKEVGNRNVYKLPQVSKATLERMGDFLRTPGATAVNAAEDFFFDRVDDSIYGDPNTRNMDPEDRPRIMPKYYIYDLERQSDVSHDLAYSYSMLAAQSNLYAAKQETLDEVMGLEQTLLNMQFENGRKAEATKIYAMFKDFMNDHYFGIKTNNKRVSINFMGMEFDITKIMFGFERFLSTMNLALSPVVAATGMVTGQANFLIESSVGQYINKDSIGYAYKEVSKLFPEYVSDIGNIDRSSRLYTVGERMGIFDFRNRVYGAGYNKALRVITRDFMFKGMEVLNAPLDPQVMVAVMDNRRYWRGRFWSKNSFNAYESDNKPTWISLRDVSLWNLSDGSGNGKFALRAPRGVDAKSDEWKEESNRALLEARNQIKSLSQITNGTLNEENRAAATRNLIARFTTAHRGWLQIAMSRLWKSRGFNFQTMQEEEGLSETLWNTLKETALATKDKGLLGAINAMREKKRNGELSPVEMANLHRAYIYMMTMFVMQGLSMLIFGLWDDEDEKDNWLTQFGTYIGMRTLNEISSQFPILTELNTIDAAREPFVSMRKIKDLVNPSNYFGTVEGGTYDGDLKLMRQISKQTFIKQWYNNRTAEDIRRASIWWKTTNNQSLGAFLGYWWTTEDMVDAANDDTSWK